MDRWNAPDLSGEVAVVTGGSAGVGRGIAEVLAACGATVFVAARNPQPAKGCVPIACDVGDDRSVDELVATVARDAGKLDLLVNNAVGWGKFDTGSSPFLYEPPWKAPLDWWNANFAVGVRSHWRVTNALAPLLIDGRRGLVLFTSERQPDEPGMQELVLDLRATVVERMALLYSLHLRPHGIASMFLYPGFTRTEVIQQAFRDRSGDFRDWTEDDFISRTASMEFTGRAVAMLAADKNILERSGTAATSHQIAVATGFTDIDGRTPDPM